MTLIVEKLRDIHQGKQLYTDRWIGSELWPTRKKDAGPKTFALKLQYRTFPFSNFDIY